MTERSPATRGESPDEWYEREKTAFRAWWESEGEKTFSRTPTLAAGAGWFARAEAAPETAPIVPCLATNGCATPEWCARNGDACRVKTPVSETPRTETFLGPCSCADGGKCKHNSDGPLCMQATASAVSAIRHKTGPTPEVDAIALRHEGEVLDLNEAHAQFNDLLDLARTLEVQRDGFKAELGVTQAIAHGQREQEAYRAALEAIIADPEADAVAIAHTAITPFTPWVAVDE